MMRQPLPIALVVLSLLSACAHHGVRDNAAAVQRGGAEAQALEQLGYTRALNPDRARATQVGVPPALDIPAKAGAGAVDPAVAFGYLAVNGVRVLLSPDLPQNRKIKPIITASPLLYADALCEQLGCLARLDWIHHIVVVDPLEEGAVITPSATAPADVDEIANERISGVLRGVTIRQILERVIPSDFHLRSELPDARGLDTYDIDYDGSRAEVIHQVEHLTMTRVHLYPALHLALVAPESP